MKTTKKYIIMCVGHTHTGKTTFAKELVKNISNLVIIDNDDISTFLNEKYSVAVFSLYNKIKRTYKEPNLKFLLAQDILKFCLRARLNIIYSSGNLGKDARLLVKRNAKKYGYNLITIYFNLPKDVILKRLHNTKKDTKSLWRSEKWSEVLSKQEEYAELPPSRKNTIYFEIKSNDDYKKVSNEVNKILKAK
jgi:adenylate kinase family enzyme